MMPRTTIDPKTTTFTIRLTPSEAESLRRCAEVLKLKKATILMRGLRWAEKEVQKRQAAVENKPA